MFRLLSEVYNVIALTKALRKLKKGTAINIFLSWFLLMI